MISSNTVSRFSFTNVRLLRFYKHIGCNKNKTCCDGIYIQVKLPAIHVYTQVRLLRATNIYIKNIVVKY